LALVALVELESQAMQLIQHFQPYLQQEAGEVEPQAMPRNLAAPVVVVDGQVTRLIQIPALECPQKAIQAAQDYQVVRRMVALAAVVVLVVLVLLQ